MTYISMESGFGQTKHLLINPSVTSLYWLAIVASVVIMTFPSQHTNKNSTNTLNTDFSLFVAVPISRFMMNKQTSK